MSASASPIRVGLIVPSSNVTIETELPALLARHESATFTFHSSRMKMQEVSEEGLRAMNAQRERCVDELSDVSCASLVYGCLVAIMAQGPGEDRRVTAAIREQLVDSAAMPALVTSADALIEAIRALGAGRVALVTPYMKPIAQKVVDYIEAERIEVTDWVALEEPDNAAVARIPGERILTAARTLDLTVADALILSACVQMPSLPLIEPAEAEFGLPVLSAATATAFTLLRRLELPTVLPGAGRLLQKDRRESDIRRLTNMPGTFKAFVVDKKEEGFTATFKDITEADLPPGEVLVKVAYSSVNYKDGLAAIPEGKIVRSYPFVPGVDLAGAVVESSDPRFKPGDEVIATSYELGVSHYGGFGEYARVKADWVVPLPAGLTLKEAMALGTAGFTAGLAVYKLEYNGLKPQNGPVLVTGATGGLGSIAISILKNLGYTVAASTGKESEHAYLKELGADDILTREETTAESNRPLEKERWAGSVDAVGGTTLAYLLRTTRYAGSIAACGNTGGVNFSTTVFPFILRSVNLLGIESVNCPMELRRQIWEHLASDYKPKHLLDLIGHEAPLEELPRALATVLKGGVRGRTVIKVSKDLRDGDL